jgi:hypothetical protein
MSETDVTRTIWPIYALRAWLGALLSQIRRAREDLEARIEIAEKEVARLRRQHERAGPIIQALQDVVELVDARLRQIRDADFARSPEKHAAPTDNEPKHEHGREHPEHSGKGDHPERDTLRESEPSNDPPAARGRRR